MPEDRRCSLCLVLGAPMMPGAEGTWCAEGDRCTEGTVKRITASSQPRDSADPCVIRSRIAAPKEECPGSVQKGGGKAKYCVWSDAGDNSTTLR